MQYIAAVFLFYIRGNVLRTLVVFIRKIKASPFTNTYDFEQEEGNPATLPAIPVMLTRQFSMPSLGLHD
ncbi:hypothetical protein Xenpb_02766 [Xenorhabdus sp. PB62.4]|nr:hypothetical protein [Xenorhabdus sp. PB62.4]